MAIGTGVTTIEMLEPFGYTAIGMRGLYIDKNPPTPGSRQLGPIALSRVVHLHRIDLV